MIENDPPTSAVCKKDVSHVGVTMFKPEELKA